MARETWYVLEDGTYADPNEVAPNEAGVLVHKGGVSVAMRGQVPSSRSVDPEEERAKAKEAAKDMKSDKPAKGYRTRESKAG